MFINSLLCFHVTILFLTSGSGKTSRYQEPSHCQYQLRDVNIFIYICRRLSHTWHLGICVILRKNSLSERQRVLAFGVMLLADFQMPSMTVPEAVSAQRYRQERPPICKPNSHIPAIQDFDYKLSNPLYIDAIGEITAITNVPIINAINKIIIGSIAASTLWVVISTSSS